MNLEKKQSQLDKGFLTAFDELIYEIKEHKKTQLPKFPINFL